MRTDISKLSFKEINHYLGVFHQMGRVALDSDWNEQNEILLRLAQRLAGDAIHSGSPNQGFRVDTRRLLDSCDRRTDWHAQPSTAPCFIDYFDYRVGDGSLVVSGSTELMHESAQRLDLSHVSELLIYAKGVFTLAECVFSVSDGVTSHAFTMSELGADGGWRVLRAVPGAWPAALDAAGITRYGFVSLVATQRYAFDALRIDQPLVQAVLRSELLDRFTVAPATAVLQSDDSYVIWGSIPARIESGSALDYLFPAPLDLSAARALWVPMRRSVPAAPFSVALIDGAAAPHTLTLSAAVVTVVGDYEMHRFALPQAGTFDWSQVVQFRLGGLAVAESYWLGPVSVETDPARDLTVHGGDGTAEGAGRYYGDGLAAIKESSGGYLQQNDLPQADPAALTPVDEGNQRIDWAYLDLWERPVSFIEAPPLREVALEGLDTCTRTQLVAQVRLLRGVPSALAVEPAPPAGAFAGLPRWGRGTLSTRDLPAAVADPCADPCEPAVQGPYLGEGNRLFRVEIQRAGDIGLANAATTALAKWSSENGAVATPLIADALAGASSALVENPDLFAVGDLIEISDDLVELITGPYEDRTNHRAHRRGEMRRVVTVNRATRRVAWDEAASPEPALHAPLPLDMRLAFHAKLTKWDGLIAVTSGDLTLADGVTIAFGGSGFIAGDYWQFATRTVDRSVERLIEAPPRGTRHAYYPLAAIHRRREAGQPEVVFAEDLRQRFAALPQLNASGVAYDPGKGLGLIPDWEQVSTVQQAIDALVEADLNGDMRLHHRLLHGMGVVCGLKLRCATDRTKIILGKGYAIDGEGYTLHQGGDLAIDLVALASAQGLLDASGDGKVRVRIERSALGAIDVEIEPYVAQSFWDSVLEGSLIKDFYDDVVLGFINFIRNQFLPFTSNTLPLPVKQRRVIACINLFVQLINSASGPYIFLSKIEHDLLSQLHQDLEDMLASQAYCAMFDGLQTIPPYPYPVPAGIETAFGRIEFHHRVKISPDGRFAYTFGLGNEIQVFDLATRELIAALPFPGGSNVQISDLVCNPNPAIAECYVVGIMSNSIDSVFATISVAAGPVFNWGPTTVVCDIRFVSLAMNINLPNRLYAVGRSVTDDTKRGLYLLTPNAIVLVPPVTLQSRLTGLIDISADGSRAYVAGFTGAADTNGFGEVRYINLTTHTVVATASFGGQFGAELQDDLTVHNGVLYVTAGSPKRLARFDALSGLILGVTPLGPNAPNRLAVLPARNELWISHADRYKAEVFEIGTSILRANFRVPLQCAPMALATVPGGAQVLAMNMISSTLSVIDVAAVSAAIQPSYTLEVGNTLPGYRHDMIKAFTDLGGVFVQSVKDKFVDKFLVECPTTGRADKIYLGSVEVRGNRVYHICNFSKRHYVKSFRTWGYWLSTVPVIPLVKRAFATFACRIF